MQPRTLQAVAQWAAALLFVAVGVLHFVRPALFVAIVPPQLPAPLALVYISGVFEILGGVGLLVPQTRRWAAYGLIALLVAVFPANIYMSVESARFAAELKLAEWQIHARLPFQALFVAWVWWVRAPRDDRAAADA